MRLEVVVHRRHPDERKGKQGNQYLNLYTLLPSKFCGQSHLLEFSSLRGTIWEYNLHSQILYTQYSHTQLLHTLEYSHTNITHTVCERENGEGECGCYPWKVGLKHNRTLIACFAQQIQITILSPPPRSYLCPDCLNVGKATLFLLLVVHGTIKQIMKACLTMRKGQSHSCSCTLKGVWIWLLME